MTKLTRIGQALLALLVLFDVVCGGYALWETTLLGHAAMTSADPPTDPQMQASLSLVSYYIQLVATGLLGVLVINAAVFGLIFGLCRKEAVRST